MGFSSLYVAISVIIKDLYAQSQVLFCASWPPSATFPHHSFRTVAHYLRLRQYIGKKKSIVNTFTGCGEKLIALPPFSLVVKERVALFRKLSILRHRLQGRQDLPEHWPFLREY